MKFFDITILIFVCLTLNLYADQSNLDIAKNKNSIIQSIIEVHRDGISVERSEDWSKGMQSLLGSLSTGQLNELLSIDDYQELEKKLSEYIPNTASIVQRDLLSEIQGVGAGPYQYYPLTPCRIVDTRIATGIYAGKINGNTEKHFWSTENTAGQIAAQGGTSGGCGVPASVKALVLNITSTNQSQGGFLTAYPTGEPRPLSSILNYQTDSIANSSIVPNCIGSCTAHFSIYSLRNSDVIIDVLGYFDN